LSEPYTQSIALLRAFERLPGENKLVIVPGATHLFAKPGALEEVARLAGEWFGKCLRTIQT